VLICRHTSMRRHRTRQPSTQCRPLNDRMSLHRRGNQTLIVPAHPQSVSNGRQRNVARPLGHCSPLDRRRQERLWLQEMRSVTHSARRWSRTHICTRNNKLLLETTTVINRHITKNGQQRKINIRNVQQKRLTHCLSLVITSTVSFVCLFFFKLSVDHYSCLFCCTSFCIYVLLAFYSFCVGCRSMLSAFYAPHSVSISYVFALWSCRAPFLSLLTCKFCHLLNEGRHTKLPNNYTFCSIHSQFHSHSPLLSQRYFWQNQNPKRQRTKHAVMFFLIPVALVYSHTRMHDQCKRT